MGQFKLLAFGAVIVAGFYATIEPTTEIRRHLICKGTTEVALNGKLVTLNSTLGYLSVNQSPHWALFGRSVNKVSFEFVHKNEIGNVLVKMDNIKTGPSGDLYDIHDKRLKLFINPLSQTASFRWKADENSEYDFTGACEKVI